MSGAPKIPPGGTIVQTFRETFADVPIDKENGNAIATTQFLDAAESLTTIFGMRGPADLPGGNLAHPVSLSSCQMSSVPLPSLPSSQTCWATSRWVARAAADEEHCVAFPRPWKTRLTHVTLKPQKIRDRQLAAPAESENIQDLCRNELKTKKHTATEGLLWLTRYAVLSHHTTGPLVPQGQLCF